MVKTISTKFPSLLFFLSQKPDRDEWGSGLEALECALQLEKSVNQSLLDLQKMATEHNDPHVSSTKRARSAGHLKDMTV